MPRREPKIFPAPQAQFHFCPRCGAPHSSGTNPLQCSRCEFVLFFNPTVAAAAFIADPDGRYLFIRRERDPARGLLGIPGGFIDIGETVEEALRREVMEEVNLQIQDMQYLCSCKNSYPYRGVTYPVCDLIFTATALDLSQVQALDAVEAYEWRDLEETPAEMLAFPSVVAGRAVLLDQPRN
jgi:ADP-ribose pyrophosphatase YjhB (NUDIX family)